MHSFDIWDEIVMVLLTFYKYSYSTLTEQNIIRHVYNQPLMCVLYQTVHE